MNGRLKLNVPNKPEYVGTVRIAAAHVAGQAGFDIEAIDDIKVAVSEACTNIVCHSNGGADFLYDVILELDDAKLTILVEDSGVGFGADDYVEPVIGEARGSGLGLFIIRALMDEVDIRSEVGAGASVCMTKYRRKRTA